MARKFITPVQDASLYQEFPLRNAGVDEILEIGKSEDGSDAIRALLQFDVTDISSSVANSLIPPGAQYILNLRTANAVNLQRSQTIEFWTIGESWDEGTGFFHQDLKNAKDGATWRVRDINEATWSLEGGTTGSLFASFSYGWNPTDIRLDITTQVRAWISGTNNGALLKLPTNDENNNNVRANAKFFSRNTHTIYPPTLEAIWVDQSIDTAGHCGLVLAEDEFDLLLPNIRKFYVTGSVNRVRVNAKSNIPIKRFTTRFLTDNDFFLPSGSMYSIVDEASNAVVVPFDSGSLISADNSGSYFNLKIENMYINRSYKVLLQIPKSWGTEILDTGHTIKVK